MVRRACAFARRLSTKAFDRFDRGRRAVPLARLPRRLRASSITPGQRSTLGHRQRRGGREMPRDHFGCSRAKCASSAALSDWAPLGATLRPKLRRHSTLPRVMRPMIARAIAGSSARRSSLMRNCRSRKRELTLLSSIATVPQRLRWSPPRKPVMLEMRQNSAQRTSVCIVHYRSAQGFIHTIRPC